MCVCVVCVCVGGGGGGGAHLCKIICHCRSMISVKTPILYTFDYFQLVAKPSLKIFILYPHLLEA